MCFFIGFDTSYTNTTVYSSEQTIATFLETVKNNPLDAKKYISKNYRDKVDISLVPQGVNTPLLAGATYTEKPKDCNTHTVLNFSDEGVAFLHFYTLKEQDKTSKWKIYALEREAV
jgi:hypothetical protein